MGWIDQKIARGELGVSQGKAEQEPEETKSKVVDLMDYLKKSVEEATEGRKHAGSASPSGTDGKGKTSKSQTAKKKTPPHRRKAG